MDEKTKYKKIWSDTGWTEKILIVVLIGYFVYLNQATALVLNINDQETPRMINGIPNEPNTLLYLPQDYVPKSNVSNTQMFIGIILSALLSFILLSKKALKDRAEISEALSDIANQIIKTKNIKDAKINASKDGLIIRTDVEEICLTNYFLTRYRFIGNVTEAFEYVISVEIKDNEGNIDYYKAHYNPLTRYLDGLIKTTKELKEEDQCPRCGKEYDERYILGADLVALKSGKELMKG